MNRPPHAPRKVRFLKTLLGFVLVFVALAVATQSWEARAASPKDKRAAAKSGRPKKAPKPAPSEEEPAAPEPANPYALPQKASRSEVAALFAKGQSEAQAAHHEPLALIAKALLAAPTAKASWPQAKVWLGVALFRLARHDEAGPALRRALGALPELDTALRMLAAQSAEASGDALQAAKLYAAVCTAKEKTPPIELALRDEEAAINEACLQKVRVGLGEKTAAAYGAELGARLKAWEATPDEKPACVEDYQFLAMRAKTLSGRTEPEAAFLGELLSPAPVCVLGREMQKRRGELVRSGAIGDPPALEAGLWRVKALLGELYHEEALGLAERLLARAEAQTSPLAPELLFQKARALFALQRYEEALALYRGLTPSFADNAKRAEDCLHGAARTLARLNRLEEAAQSYAALAGQTSDKKLALNARFLSSWLLGFRPATRAQAIAGLDAFSSANPRQNQGRQARWFAAFFTYQSGSPEETLERLAAVARDKDLRAWHGAARYFSARSLEKLGRLREARSYYAYLAGTPEFSYYRLLAAERLRPLLPGPAATAPIGTPAATTEAAPEPEPATREDAAYGPVNDAEVNGRLAERLAAWRQDERRAKSSPENEEERFVAALTTAQATLRQAGQNDAPTRERAFAALAKTWDPLFWAFARARAWQRLGFENEARHDLLLFWGQLNRHLGRRVGMAGDGKSPLLEGRRKLHAERAALIAKAPAGFFADLALWALALNDSALAYQIRHRLPDAKSRIKLLTKLLAGGIKVAPLAPKTEAAATGGESEETEEKAEDEESSSRDNARWLHYPPAYAETLCGYARDVKLPVALALAIMRSESAYRPDVVSPMQAVGLLQIMPHTADRLAALLNVEGFSRAALFEPPNNLRFGTYYLARLIDTFNGQWPLAIASYNAGPFNVRTWMERTGPLPLDEFIETFEFVQTRDYVKKVLTAQAAYKNLYGADFSACPLAVPFDPQVKPDGVSF